MKSQVRRFLNFRLPAASSGAALDLTFTLQFLFLLLLLLPSFTQRQQFLAMVSLALQLFIVSIVQHYLRLALLSISISIAQPQHCLAIALALLSISIAQRQHCLALALVSLNFAQPQLCLALAMLSISALGFFRVPQVALLTISIAQHYYWLALALLSTGDAKMLKFGALKIEKLYKFIVSKVSKESKTLTLAYKKPSRAMG